MKEQSKNIIIFIFMLLFAFALTACQNTNDEILIKETNLESNVEMLGEFESDPEFEELMKMCEIQKNPQTNELEKEIISFSNDEIALLNFNNTLYTAFVFENDVYNRSELYFYLETPEIASEFYNTFQNPNFIDKYESPEDLDDIKSVKRLGSYIIFECKLDDEDYRDMTIADMKIALDLMVYMYEKEE